MSGALSHLLPPLPGFIARSRCWNLLDLATGYQQRHHPEAKPAPKCTAACFAT